MNSYHNIPTFNNHPRQPHQSTRLYPLQKQVKREVTDCSSVIGHSALIINAIALYLFLMQIKWHFIRNKAVLYH